MRPQIAIAVAAMVASLTAPAVAQVVSSGKSQSHDAPGSSSFGSFTFGPGGVTNYLWQIDDPGSNQLFPSAPGVAGVTSSVTGQPDFGWSLIKAIKVGSTSGNFNWTATTSNPLTIIMQTLTGQTTVGNDVLGPMQNWDPSLYFVWPILTWQGNYNGPTDFLTLNSEIIFDVTNGPFANPYGIAPITGGLPFFLDIRFAHGNSGPGELDLFHNTVPEPGTFALVAAGLLAVLRRRRIRGQVAPPLG
jgi:hypothetical protein